MSGLWLFTGNMGAGKTLFAIDAALKLQNEDPENPRPVYHCRVPGVTLPGWTQIESMNEWPTLPDNAIVMGDEIWMDWPADKNKEGINEAIKHLRLLRKSGKDIFLITQDIMDINVAIRRLVTEHTHIARVGGLERARIFVWPYHQSRPNDAGERFKCKEQYERDYPKELYDVYRSADAGHNVVKRLPRGMVAKFAVLASLIVVGVGGFVTLGFTVSSKVSEQTEVSEDDVAQPAKLTPVKHEPQSFIPPPPSVRREPAGGADVSLPDMLKPQITGLPWTSLFYESQYVANTYPRPHCIIFAGECRCYTQQSTRLKLTDKMCRYYQAFGYFDPSRDDEDSRDNSDTEDAVDEPVLEQVERQDSIASAIVGSPIPKR